MKDGFYTQWDPLPRKDRNYNYWGVEIPPFLPNMPLQAEGMAIRFLELTFKQKAMLRLVGEHCFEPTGHNVACYFLRMKKNAHKAYGPQAVYWGKWIVGYL